MQKYLSVMLLSLFVLAGCGNMSRTDKKVLARINNYEISVEEFERAFRDSVYGLTDTAESRRKFLEALINQKLILQEAERQGLDREGAFLASIERFWEQSLLKIALDRKSKEIAASTRVTDREIEEAYRKMAAEGKTTKEYAEMYPQIKWELSKRKESEELNNWMSGLYNAARIRIDYEALKKDGK